ncbi:unnamed protein product [Albugo candida]|uniref:Uncharacterized protein n=1 Tax=Albugo candida TaxID=65357 RepID=A0A024FVX2_9STRA|nr:unnamed protein product [Albugo candida]|eukprot:CCI10814.1 unnamed protein product [Albugo candida]
MSSLSSWNQSNPSCNARMRLKCKHLDIHFSFDRWSRKWAHGSSSFSMGLCGEEAERRLCRTSGARATRHFLNKCTKVCEGFCVKRSIPDKIALVFRLRIHSLSRLESIGLAVTGNDTC